jgi:hypothetical protein
MLRVMFGTFLGNLLWKGFVLFIAVGVLWGIGQANKKSKHPSHTPPSYSTQPGSPNYLVR